MATRSHERRLQALAECSAHLSRPGATYPIPTLQGHISPTDGESLAAARVIVGLPGSGKSTALREVLRTVSPPGAGPDTLVVTAPAPDSGTLQDIARSFLTDQPGRYVERWRQIWRTAFLLHLYSRRQQMAAPLHPGGAAAEHPGASEGARSILGQVEARALHPFRILTLLAPHLSSGDFRLDDDLWRVIESGLVEDPPEAPISVIALDNFDDEADNAPAVRQVAHAGLVAEVLRVDSSPLRNWVVPVVSCSPTVLRRLEVVRRTGTNILEIDWDTESLLRFACTRLAAGPTATLGQALRAITGIDHVSPSGRTEGITEDLASYILRHTGGTPNDILIVLRSVLRRLTRCPNLAHGPTVDRAIRRAITLESSLIGRAALYRTTTNCLARGEEGPQETLGVSTRPLQVSVLAFLKAIGHELASKDRYQRLAYVAFDHGLDDFVLEEMWSSRMIGKFEEHATGAGSLTFGGAAGDVGLNSFDVSTVGMNSCLLEVVGDVRLAASPPRHLFE